MTPRKTRYSRYALQIAAAALISTCCLQPVAAGQTTDVAVDAEAVARDNWRAVMAHNTDLWEGLSLIHIYNAPWKNRRMKCNLRSLPWGVKRAPSEPED